MVGHTGPALSRTVLIGNDQDDTWELYSQHNSHARMAAITACPEKLHTQNTHLAMACFRFSNHLTVLNARAAVEKCLC